jgi:hypothetical protein
MTTRIVRHATQLAVCIFLVACGPGDNGETDSGPTPAEDAGGGEEDAGYDAGEQPDRDGGQSGNQCPSFLTSPVGASCSVEGTECRSDGCGFAPGPNCLRIQCICDAANDCSWQNQAFQDAGSDDSGTTDSGTTDSGTTDSGTSDSGTSDSGTSDSGTSDSGTTDSGTDGG